MGHGTGNEDRENCKSGLKISKWYEKHQFFKDDFFVDLENNLRIDNVKLKF